MKTLLTIAVLSLVLFVPIKAYAQDNPWAQGENVFAQIISGYRTVPPKDKMFKVALAVTFKAGWHGYAKNFGAVGMRPSFDWSRSKNVAQLEIMWPAPKRFQEEDQYSFGYDGETFFPMIVTPSVVGKPIELVVDIDMLACGKRCSAERLAPTLKLGEGESQVSMDAPIVEKSFAALPTKGDYVTLNLDLLKVEKNGLVFHVYSLNEFGENADLFIVGDKGSPPLFNPPIVTPSKKDPHEATFAVSAPPYIRDLKKALEGHTLTVTLVNAGHAIEKEFSF